MLTTLVNSSAIKGFNGMHPALAGTYKDFFPRFKPCNVFRKFNHKLQHKNLEK